MKTIKTHSKHYKKPLIWIGCLILAMQFIGLTRAYAQSAKTKAEDIRQINQLLTQVHSVADTNTKAALKLIIQVKKLCAIAKVDTLNARTYLEEGFCYFYSGNYKRAEVLFDSSAYLWKKVNQSYYFKALNDKANALMYNAEYHKALITFFECLDISNSTNNKKMTGQVLNNIGLVYESIGDFDNALLYEKRSLPYKIAAKDTHSLARTYGNIGNAFEFKDMPDSGIFYEKHSYQLYEMVDDKEGMSNSLGDIGIMLLKKKMVDSAINYLQRALVIAEKLSNAENTANFEDNLAEIYLQYNLKTAWKYASQANAYVSQITDNEFLQRHYSIMYRYFKQTHNVPQAFGYLEKLNAVNDSVFKEKINIQNEKVAFEYEYKQKKLKDSLIFQSQLNASERKAIASRTRFIMAFLLLIVAVLLAIILYNRSKLLQRKNILAQQNVELQGQKIRELENEKQILASQAILKGQEDERSRLAKDLHDGLGGLLSGVKHSIINMKENVIMSGDNASIFEKSLDMIDTATRELRRVAQNMMPEALAKFGLEAALNDYCASSCTSTVKVIFHAFGEDVKIKSSDEIIIYRIIQELVNNAMKHANATQVMVQLVKGEDWITISVEDNGKGFNANDLPTSAGAGWGNIKSRVNYLNGNIDLKSQVGTGTSVNIEIKIQKT